MKGISILSVGRLVEYLVAFFSGDKRLYYSQKKQQPEVSMFVLVLYPSKSTRAIHMAGREAAPKVGCSTGEDPRAMGPACSKHCSERQRSHPPSLVFPRE